MVNSNESYGMGDNDTDITSRDHTLARYKNLIGLIRMYRCITNSPDIKLMMINLLIIAGEYDEEGE